jgi:hypothetical protein
MSGLLEPAELAQRRDPMPTDLPDRVLESLRVREIEAGALRDAADELERLGRGCGPEYATWLRERADKVATT